VIDRIQNSKFFRLKIPEKESRAMDTKEICYCKKDIISVCTAKNVKQQKIGYGRYMDENENTGRIIMQSCFGAVNHNSEQRRRI
jgi:hypothetical protein